MCNYTKNTPLATARTQAAGIAGSAEIGSLCDGCCRMFLVLGRALMRAFRKTLSRSVPRKLLDNLRRSLVSPALTLLFLLGWTILSSAWFWTLSMIGIIAIPSLIASVLDVLQKPGDVLLGQHLSASVRAARRRFALAAFSLACLPYEAFYSLDAIVRTTWRMLVTHRRLLEWNPSNDPGRTSRTGLFASYRTMWIAPVIAIAAVIYLARSGRRRSQRPGPAGPLVFLPVIAWWISRPLTRRGARLTDEQTLFLRKLSERPGAFFETFVGPEDHWLPPDNYQEHPVGVVAHRTSPTTWTCAARESVRT